MVYGSICSGHLIVLSFEKKRGEDAGDGDEGRKERKEGAASKLPAGKEHWRSQWHPMDPVSGSKVGMMIARGSFVGDVAWLL